MSTPTTPSYSYPCHEDCNITFPNFTEFLKHHDSAVCNPPRKLMCEGCPGSKRIFVHIAAADQHIHDRHEPEYHAKCMMCNAKFVSTAALGRHITVPCTNYAEYKCDVGKCTRGFYSKAALEAHKRSARHNHITPGLKCFGDKCKRKFNSPSAMLAHLESGACVCGADRNSLRKVLMEKDTMGIITDRAAVQRSLESGETASVNGSLLEDSRPVTPLTRSSNQSVVSLRSYRSSNSLSNESAYSFIQDSDSEILTHHEGGVYLSTPLASSAASSGVLLPTTTYTDRSDDDWSSIDTPSSRHSLAGSDTSSIYEIRHRRGTPSIRSEDSYPSTQDSSSDTESIASDHTEVGVKPFCTLCSDEERALRGPFPNLKALEQHQRSGYHAPAVYHCPKVSFVKGLTGPDSVDVVFEESHAGESKEDKGHKGRTFKTLQGLAAHVESNACKGGRGMFGFAMEYLSRQLEGMGLGGKLEWKGAENAE